MIFDRRQDRRDQEQGDPPSTMGALGMARGPLTFRQRDVVAAIRAVRRAGIEVGRIEIGKDGKIIIVIAMSDSYHAADQITANEWDAVLR